MTSKTCIMCDSEPATHGIDCHKCAAVMMAMTVVRRHWQTTEYKGLADALRAETIDQYTRTAFERSAWISARLGTALGRLVHISGTDEVSFKSALFRQMQHDAGEIEGLGKIEGGLEAWRKRVCLAAGQCADALFKAARKAHNPKALVP